LAGKVSGLHRQPYPRREAGAHALFTAGADSPALSQVVEEVFRHTGNLWLPTLSLRREDAARLVYENAELSLVRRFS
jgi:hypothetical protein